MKSFSSIADSSHAKGNFTQLHNSKDRSVRCTKQCSNKTARSQPTKAQDTHSHPASRGSVGAQCYQLLRLLLQAVATAAFKAVAGSCNVIAPGAVTVTVSHSEYSRSCHSTTHSQSCICSASEHCPRTAVRQTSKYMQKGGSHKCMIHAHDRSPVRHCPVALTAVLGGSPQSP